ncbi:MAG: glycosyltransferase family 2 protein [Betaproteobacteria bacterium]|nr:glycosyltransferase family 2 protein [Betaproteobacteria bacterium]
MAGKSQEAPGNSRRIAHSSISVIVVNCNSGDLLVGCIDALAKQTFPVREIIVVDNASIDSSLAHLEERIQSLKVVRLNHNSGFAAANNLAAELAADSEWIALLNPDAFPQPAWLESLMRAADAFPDYSCFASRMIQAKQPTLLDGAGDAYHVSGRVWRRGYGMPADGHFGTREEVFSACAAAALYRRSAIEAAGGFDEDFFCYLEDVDLGFRLRLAGYRCLYVPDAVVYHVGSATTGKDSDFAVYHGHRNLVWTYVKNMPGPLFWLYLPAHVAANIAGIAWYALRNRWRIILRAKWDAIKGLRQMWRKRKDIQARRAVSAWAIRNAMEKGWPRRRR